MQAIRLRSEVAIALQNVTRHLRRAQSALGRFASHIAEPKRLERTLRATQEDLRKLLHSGQHTLTSFQGTIVSKSLILQSAFRARKNHLRKLFRRGQVAFTRVRKRVANKPLQLRGALRARENGLKILLANSIEAVVVINDDHSLISANSKALDLFGISESNLGKFTIDAFVCGGKNLAFDGGRSRFVRGAEKHGRCQIRRLNGSVRVVEYIYVANFAPFRHLCRFRNVSAIERYRPALRREVNQSVDQCNAP